MSKHILWIAPTVLVSSIAPGYATTYLSLDQAQKAIFPGAKMTPADVTLSDQQRKKIEKLSGVRVRNPQQKIWRVENGGWFILDEVVGKHEFITYAVGLNENGSVKQIEVMDYRETYGDQVRGEQWRSQFVGKKFGDKLKLDEDIKNISGATLSSRHITDGVRRLLALYETVLKK